MEIWDARRIDKLLEVGRTHPLIAECAGPLPENTERRSFVIKAMGLPEIHEVSLCSELTGNLLARLIGVDTATPALIHLSPEFVKSSQDVLARNPGLVASSTKLLPGYGAGCEFLSQGFFPIMPDTRLTENELPQAACIYVYDMLSQNPDRSFETGRKPNCAHYGQRLIAYDFELSFSFLFAISAQDKAWEITRHGLSANHIFHKQLRAGVKSEKVDLHPIVAKVAALDIDALIETMQRFPSSWLKYAGKIEAHLKEVVAHTREFEIELHRSLI